jgi:hypothetical protein
MYRPKGDSFGERVAHQMHRGRAKGLSVIDGGPFVTAARSQIGASGITLSIGHGFTAMSRACTVEDN